MKYRVRFTKNFEKSFSKIRDAKFKDKIKKQIGKIKLNPNIGKPMKYGRLGTRELYVKPYRISYKFEKNVLIIYFLEIYHKKFQ